MTLSRLRDEIIKKIAELGEVAPEDVSESRSLRDLGIDSLMSIELVVHIERLIQRQIPEGRMGGIRTCADVFREVELLLSPAA
jgi:acyl carrier protein